MIHVVLQYVAVGAMGGFSALAGWLIADKWFKR